MVKTVLDRNEDLAGTAPIVPRALTTRGGARGSHGDGQGVGGTNRKSFTATTTPQNPKHKTLSLRKSTLTSVYTNLYQTYSCCFSSNTFTDQNLSFTQHMPCVLP